MDSFKEIEIQAKVVLSDSSVDVKFLTDAFTWIMSDDRKKQALIWDYVREKYPINFKIAMNITMEHPYSSYVYTWEEKEW
jgi:hypothetical protein